MSEAGRDRTPVGGPGREAPAGRRPARLRAVPIVVPLVLVAAVLVGLSLRREPPDVFAATPDGLAEPPDSAGFRVITLDARDPGRWRFLSLEQGRVLERPDPLAWDLAVRRFHLIANGGPSFLGSGGFLDLGDVPLETARPPDSGYQPTGPDSVHPVTSRWYRYGFTSHLLTPKPRSYAVRTAGGRTGVFAILGYYCEGPTPGCLTIRYRLAP